jgi:hypothetical protein
VVPTPAGVEGLFRVDGAVVTSHEGGAGALADLLADPQRAAALGAAGRQAILAAHAPLPAARARVDAIRTAFGS